MRIDLRKGRRIFFHEYNTVELIPVLEIAGDSTGITDPEKYPYWEHPEQWFAYRNRTFKKTGFEDELIPYLNGSPFFEIKKLTDKNLAIIVLDHTEGLRSGEYERDDACALWGGFVLKVYSEDQFFPQCCGELSDIKFWEETANGKQSYYEGHPGPGVEFRDSTIIFDLMAGEFDEEFCPTPPNQIVEVSRKELECAVQKARAELHIFGNRLNQLNQDMNLGIDRIEDLLIWENVNYD